MAQFRQQRVSLLKKTATSGLTTDTGDSITEPEPRESIGAMLIVRNLTGTAPSITGKVQHSADDASITDANAAWVDLLTFTAITANGAQFQKLDANSYKYFPRLRAQVTRAGTAVTNLDYDLAII